MCVWLPARTKISAIMKSWRPARVDVLLIVVGLSLGCFSRDAMDKFKETSKTVGSESGNSSNSRVSNCCLFAYTNGSAWWIFLCLKVNKLFKQNIFLNLNHWKDRLPSLPNGGLVSFRWLDYHWYIIRKTAPNFTVLPKAWFYLGFNKSNDGKV